MKVVYFKMAGRAGAVRAALKLARIKYENDFVDRDSMQELKPRLPFGQVPVFEVNGEIVAQSNAFLRYVGKFSGLYPDDPFDALKVDEIVDGVSDSMLLLRPSLLEKNVSRANETERPIEACDPCSALSPARLVAQSSDSPHLPFSPRETQKIYENESRTRS